MNIAVVLMMHEEPFSGGELSNLLNLVPTLNLFEGHTAQGFIFTDRPPTKNWDIDARRTLRIIPRTKIGYHLLNDFDYVIFSAPGSRGDRKTDAPWWAELLDTIHVPFAIQIQCEDNARIFVHRDEFLHHPKCNAVIEIEYGFAKLIVPNAKQPAFRIGPFNYEQLYGYVALHLKERLVVSTSMLATRKRVLALAHCYEDLKVQGFDLKIYGMSYAWSQASAIKALGVPYLGPFVHAADVVAPAMFHYNGSSKGIPRIELTTFEAVMHGCAPILNKNFAPSWVNKNMAVLVSLTDDGKLDGLQDLGTRSAMFMNEFFVKELRRHNPLRDLREFFDYIR